MRRRIRALARIAAPVVLVLAGAALAHAQARHPFAVGGSEGGGPGGPVGQWLMAEQSRFYRLLTAAVREARTSGAAFWTLAGLSFAYGALHAAGPGHGKAVMASYMVANERALARGLVLTAGAALLQAAIAIALVGIMAVALGATAARMTQAAFAIETASYLAIAALGAWLVWTKSRALAAALAARAPSRMVFAGGAFAARATSRGFVCEAVDADHVHDAACGHVHAPDPATLGESFSWTSALGTMVAAGARPCSGAILALVFALAQGAFWLGVAAALFMAAGTALTTGALAATAVYAKRLATRLAGAGSARGLVVARAAEFLAALAVLAFGLILLFVGAAGVG